MHRWCHITHTVPVTNIIFGMLGTGMRLTCFRLLDRPTCGSVESYQQYVLSRWWQLPIGLVDVTKENKKQTMPFTIYDVSGCLTTIGKMRVFGLVVGMRLLTAQCTFLLCMFAQ
jgi:hypothetical protein